MSTAAPQQELQQQLAPQLAQLMCGQGDEGEALAGTHSMLTESSGASGTAVERPATSVHTSVRAATEREGMGVVVATEAARGSRQRQVAATRAGAVTAEAAEAAAAVQFLLQDVCEVVAVFGQLGELKHQEVEREDQAVIQCAAHLLGHSGEWVMLRGRRVAQGELCWCTIILQAMTTLMSSRNRSGTPPAPPTVSPSP